MTHTPTHPNPRTAKSTAGERWARTAEQLRGGYVVLLGDILLAAAFVSYAGPFTSRFRAGLIAEWIKFLGDKKVPMTAGITGGLLGKRGGWIEAC